MTARAARQPQQSYDNESDFDRLRRSTTAAAMSVGLVSAFAGDRELTAPEQELIRLQKTARGDLFYSDLLYAISHHYFAPEVAESVWEEILSHQHAVSSRLGRNVRVAVAALDYLSNVSSELPTATLISEATVAQLASLALRDGMTGLFNHSTCYELLDLELRKHRRYGVGVCVVLLDIDDFKAINAQAGLQEGDRVLVELARALAEEARDTDICCRLGGDEFVIILGLDNDPIEVCRVAERIKARAAEIVCLGRPVAISIGVASCDSTDSSPRSLLDRADRALRRAKEAGKNRVVLSSTS